MILLNKLFTNIIRDYNVMIIFLNKKLLSGYKIIEVRTPWLQFFRKQIII